MVDLLLPIVLVVIGMIALSYASAKIVDVLVSISPLLKLPKFLVSFVFIGLGTAFPDILISSIGALGGNIALAVGSLLGSSIVILCLVLGVVVLYKGFITIDKELVTKNFVWLFLVALSPLVLMFDGNLSLFDGTVMIALYATYLIRLKSGANEVEMQTSEKKNWMLQALQLVALIAVILIAANVAVDNSILIANELGVPTIFVGIVLIALGLAMPELVIDLNAIRQKEEELVWGDLIGSFITELSIVLGIAGIVGALGIIIKQGTFSIASVFTGLPIALGDIIVAYSFLFVALMLLFFFTKTKQQIGRAEAVLLIALYIVFVSLQFDVFV